jgi:hypothetical protein
MLIYSRAAKNFFQSQRRAMLSGSVTLQVLSMEPACGGVLHRSIEGTDYNGAFKVQVEGVLDSNTVVHAHGGE